MIRIGIIDDHKIFRHGLQLSLSKYVDVKTEIEAGNSTELYEKIAQQSIDVLLCDLKLPGQDGAEITRYMTDFFPETKVLILSSTEDENTVSHLMNAGAAGYLFKHCEPSDIYNAIKSAHETGYYVNAAVSKALLKKPVKTAPIHLNGALKVNEKEIDVLRYVMQELTASEIAEKMGISARTVESIKDRLIKRFDVKNSVGLVAYALRNNIIN